MSENVDEVRRLILRPNMDEVAGFFSKLDVNAPRSHSGARRKNTNII